MVAVLQPEFDQPELDRSAPVLHLVEQTLPIARRRRSVYYRRRAVVAVLAVLLLWGILALVRSGADRVRLDGPPSLPVLTSTSHLVQPGDTLWSVARSMQPEGDVRPLVSTLSELNGGPELVPGQLLRLAPDTDAVLAASADVAS